MPHKPRIFLQKIHDIILVLLYNIIGKATSCESKLACGKLRADYYRYIAEFSDGSRKSVSVNNVRKAYDEAVKCAEQSLPETHPIPLGLALRFVVLGCEANAEYAKEYRGQVEQDMQKIYDVLLELLDSLIGKAITCESKVVYPKLGADYFCYIAEFNDGVMESAAASNTRKAYDEAAKFDEQHLPVTHPIWLGHELRYYFLDCARKYCGKVDQKPQKICDTIFVLLDINAHNEAPQVGEQDLPATYQIRLGLALRFAGLVCEANAEESREYCRQVEQELQKIYDNILPLLDNLIVKASSRESKLVYQKLGADYYRYIAEFTDVDMKSAAAKNTLKAYDEAAKFDLGLELSFSFWVMRIFRRSVTLFSSCLTSTLPPRTFSGESKVFYQDED